MGDFADAAKKLEKVSQRIEDSAEAAAERALEDTVDDMQRHLRANDAVATRRLLTSLDVRRMPVEATAFASFGIWAADYWKYVEFGTGMYTSRGYKAPDYIANVAAIHEWVKAKGIVPRPDGPYNNQRELAGAIARSLTRGTPVQRFVRPAWRGPRGKKHLKKVISKSIERTVEREF